MNKKINNLKVSIVAPVYNEGENINFFYESLIKYLIKNKIKYSKIILVIDPSEDNTFYLASKLAKKNRKLKIILFSKRFGHQQALLCGLNQVENSDVTIMLDSDLQHPLNLIKKMVETYCKGFDIVNTKRIFSSDVSIFNKITSFIFYKFFNKLTGLNMETYGADFRLISEKVRMNIVSNFSEQNFFLRGVISWVGFKQTSLSYTALERKNGVSKFNLFSRLRFAYNGILSFSFLPIKFFIYFGFAMSLISFLLTIFHVVEYLNNSVLPPGWTTIIVLLTFYFGVSFIFLGILAKYISLIYLQVIKRPRYIIDEELN